MPESLYSASLSLTTSFSFSLSLSLTHLCDVLPDLTLWPKSSTPHMFPLALSHYLTLLTSHIPLVKPFHYLLLLLLLHVWPIVLCRFLVSSSLHLPSSSNASQLRPVACEKWVPSNMNRAELNKVSGWNTTFSCGSDNQVWHKALFSCRLFYVFYKPSMSPTWVKKTDIHTVESSCLTVLYM